MAGFSLKKKDVGTTPQASAKLANGQYWTAQKFQDHSFEQGSPGQPPSPVDVDRNWYMSKEGPGRYYHPGMFPIIQGVAKRQDLAPGVYDLRDFVANRDANAPALKASISHYTTDPLSRDHWQRLFVFGDESARISGRVVVGSDGSKRFEGIEIRPFDTDFDYRYNSRNPLIEAGRAIGKLVNDPFGRGLPYDIRYVAPGFGTGPDEDRGHGRLFDPFTMDQLQAAEKQRNERSYRAPPWLLPSIVGKDPVPYLKEYQQYENGLYPRENPIMNSATENGLPADSTSYPESPSNIGGWVAGLAGVDPDSPMNPASQPPQDEQLSPFIDKGPPWTLLKKRCSPTDW